MKLIDHILFEKRHDNKPAAEYHQSRAEEENELLCYERNIELPQIKQRQCHCQHEQTNGATLSPRFTPLLPPLSVPAGFSPLSAPPFPAATATAAVSVFGLNNSIPTMPATTNVSVSSFSTITVIAQQAPAIANGSHCVASVFLAN